MLNAIIAITVGVMLGTLLASLIAVSVLFNKRVLTWYFKKCFKLSEEMMEAMTEDLEQKEEE